MIPPSPQFPFFTKRIYFCILGCSGSLLLCRLSLHREQGLLSTCDWGSLIVVASVAAEDGLSGTRASVVAAHGVSNFSPQALSTVSVVVAQGLSCSTACGWDHPRSGTELMSLPLASEWFTTEPPGKPSNFHLFTKSCLGSLHHQHQLP